MPPLLAGIRSALDSLYPGIGWGIHLSLDQTDELNGGSGCLCKLLPSESRAPVYEKTGVPLRGRRFGDEEDSGRDAHAP
jgi:hypothetical protein